jgi:hypothetical protein
MGQDGCPVELQSFTVIVSFFLIDQFFGVLSMKLAVLVVVLSVSSATWVIAAETTDASLTEAEQKRLADPQTDINCKMYGFAGAMFSDRRASGMSKEEAAKDARENFDRLETPTDRDVKAKAFVLSSLDAVSDQVYGNDAISPATASEAYLHLCFVRQVRQVDIAKERTYLSASAACEKEHPMDAGVDPRDVLNPRVIAFRGCVQKAVTELVQSE